MKKSLTLILFILFSLSISTSSYSGDVDGCTITRVGAYPALQNDELKRSGYPVFLSQPTAWTGPRSFFLSTSLGEAGLATLLTAMSLGKKVMVRIGDSSTAPNTAGSIITVIYVNQ